MNKCQAQGMLFVEFHIRGRRKKRASLTRHCGTLAEIIRQGEEMFPSFHSRNPWIVMNSDCNRGLPGGGSSEAGRSVPREKAAVGA